MDQTVVPIDHLQQRAARLAGACYVAIAVLGGFAELFVRARVHVAGDAAATAEAYAANVGLVRAGIVADLVQAVLFVVLALLLFVVLRHVNGRVAASMVVLVAISGAIITLNMVFQQGALMVATGSEYVGSFGMQTRQGLVLLLSDLQYHGYLIAGIFFGLWLVPLGWLAIRSGRFPRALGVLLVIGAAGYLVETFTIFAIPRVGEAIADLVVIPGAVAELWMAAYLLAIGVRWSTPRTDPASS